MRVLPVRFLLIALSAFGVGFESFALAQAGELLVTSWNNDSVIRYDATTGALLGTLVASGAGNLNQPHSARFGPDGNLYVTSFANDRVVRFDGQTGAFIDNFVAPKSGGLDGPTDAVFGPDGHLYVSSFFTPAVLRYDGQSGAFLNVFIGSGNGLQNAESGHFGPNGDYYLANGQGNSVLRYDGKTGAFIGVAASGGGLNDPHDFDFGPNGNLFVTTFGRARINEYDAQTGAFVQSFISSGNGLINAHGLVFRDDGFLYVAAFGRDRVLRYDATTGAFDSTFVAPGAGGLDGPISLTFVPDPPSVASYGCGLNPAGSLSVLSGTSALSSNLVLGVDNPLGNQSAGALPFLFLSFEPDANFPCGTPRPGFGQAGPGATGEILIGLQRPAFFATVSGPPWLGSGSPSSFALTLPPDATLVGLHFYAQGFLLDSSAGASVRFGLTDALDFLIGF